MTEQQEHLQNLLAQQKDLITLIEQKRSLLLRTQGAIEYLNQVGVTLPKEEEEAQEAPTEVVEDDV
tara:strand:+ start:55 stop:252 length:198 start_codon:yes stop_codon:yes gene_type:complete